MHFEFERIYFFLLLLPIACIYLCPVKAPKRYFVHLHLFEVSKGFLDKEKLLVASILTLFTIALASPVTYEQKFPDKRKGRALVIVLDSSGSMSQSGYDAQQEDMSKFDAVKKVLADFIEHRGDDNIGVVLFGTFAFAASPLTYDMSSLRFMLRYIEPGLAGENTAIGDGLHEALGMLASSGADKKVIVLLSDGYQNSGSHSIKEEVQRALQKGVRIYTIGLGKDGDYDAKLLEKIATQSGGKFFKAPHMESLQKVYKELDSLEPSPLRSARYLNKHSLFTLPLLVGLLLLGYLLYRREAKQ